MAHISHMNGAAGYFLPMATLLTDAVSTILDGLRTVTVNPLPVLVRMQARIEQRRRLADLDDRLLADIGLDRVDAMQEAAKPFWRV